MTYALKQYQLVLLLYRSFLCHYLKRLAYVRRFIFVETNRNELY